MKTIYEFLINKKIVKNNNLVDLNLPSGTLWCACNVGASKPEEYGNYYKWGETTPMNKWDDETGYEKPIENGELPDKNDAATVELGKNYKMPTSDNFYELFNNTNYKIVKNYNNSGINGYLFTSKDKNNTDELFLPFAGMFDETNAPNETGNSFIYWCKDTQLYVYNVSGNNKSYEINIILSVNFGKIEKTTTNYGYYGGSIRPVYII